MSEIRVLVFDGPRRFHVDERPTPQPAAGEVRIRIAFVGICGSDLHGYTGESGRRVAGMVMGHEASGWIEALGPGVRGPEIGTPVTFNPSLACDGACGHQIENHCSDLRVIGVTPEIQGAFADAIVVPANRVVPLGAVSLEWGAVVEPLAVGVQAVRRAEVSEGQSVLVVGAGMIGQCIARAARLAGAESVTLTDMLATRCDQAIKSGFRGVAPDEVGELGPFDVSFDAVGISPTAASAIQNVRKGSNVCFVGLGKAEVSIPLFDVVVAERKIVGTFAYTDSAFQEARNLISAGQVDMGALIGGIESFEDISDAFEALATNERVDAKVLMSTAATGPLEG